VTSLALAVEHGTIRPSGAVAFLRSRPVGSGMSKATRLLTVLLGLFVVASVVHYALFGALPFGKPQLLEEDEEGAETDAAVEVVE